MPRKKVKRKASQCKTKKNGERCGGRYILNYDNNTPIFKCNVCNDIDLTWKKFYVEYLQLFRQKDNWNDKKHQVSCIIGFFCYCYKEFYKIDYIFVPQSVNPYNCKECRDALLLLKTFNDANVVRKYIHWFFNKFLNPSIEISSLGYLNSPGIIRKYNLYFKKSKFLNRASELPSNFIFWCKENIPEIFDLYSLETMNDLGAIFRCYDAQQQNSIEYRLVSRAKKMKLIARNRLNVRG
jgi:hypothetical protein